MPWVRFLQPFDWPVPSPVGSTIAYKTGEVFNVTRKCRADAGERAVPATREEITEARANGQR